jgi:hypothetical protein
MPRLSEGRNCDSCSLAVLTNKQCPLCPIGMLSFRSDGTGARFSLIGMLSLRSDGTQVRVAWRELESYVPLAIGRLVV